MTPAAHKALWVATVARWLQQPQPAGHVTFGAFAMPRFVFDRLYDYQAAGVEWLLSNFAAGVNCLLADEMGLGKTVQMLALVSAHFETVVGRKNVLRAGDRLAALRAGEHRLDAFYDTLVVAYDAKVLVLAPVTLLEQIKGEFEAFNPFLPLFCHYSHTVKKSFREQNGVHFMCYECFRANHATVARTQFELLVLDEAHVIRNCNSRTTLLVKSVRAQFKLAMTGTPVQNCLAELWSIVDFLRPGLLGTLPVFAKTFVQPIEAGLRQSIDELKARDCARRLKLLRNIIFPHILRRTRKDVRVLRELSCVDLAVTCDITPLQYKLYEQHLKLHGAHLRNCLNSQARSAAEQRKGDVLRHFNILSIISNHPDILLRSADPVCLHSVARSFAYGHFSRSGKLQTCLQVLQLLVRERRKVIVFSQRISVLDILARYMPQFGAFLRLDGSVASCAERNSMIERFNSDQQVAVMLLSTRVGGVGLNLTAASAVIIFDLDWNPANDSQALSRCFRFGQTRDICLVRLLSDTPFENYLYTTQKFKIGLSESLLGEQEAALEQRAAKVLLSYPNPPAGLAAAQQDAQLLACFFKALVWKFRGFRSAPPVAAWQHSSAQYLELPSLPQTAVCGAAADNDDSERAAKRAKPDLSAAQPTLAAAELGEVRTREPDDFLHRLMALPNLRVELTPAAQSVVGDEERTGLSKTLGQLIVGGKLTLRQHRSLASAFGQKAQKAVRHASFADFLECQKSSASWQPNVPTWTGSKGLAGKPERVRARSALQLEVQTLFADVIAELGLCSEPLRSLFEQLVKTLASAPGPLLSTDLIDRFASELREAETAKQFKVMLNRLCDKVGDASPLRWALKPTFAKRLTSLAA